MISRSVSTLGRVVAHWRGLSRVARVSPCAAQPPTAGSRRAGTGTETSRVSASAPLESGHSRDTGQGTVGEPLAAAAAATLEAAPSITSCCWVPCSCSAGHQAAGQLRVSLVSTEDHHPATQLSLWLAPLPSHPDRARWRKLHSFRQRGLVISIMPVISARSGSSIRARGSAVFPKEDSDCFMRWPVFSVEELGEGLHSTRTDTSLSIPRPNPGRPLLRNIISNASSQVLTLLSIWLKLSVTVLKLISESAPNPSELVLLIPSKLISPPPPPLLCPATDSRNLRPASKTSHFDPDITDSTIWFVRDYKIPDASM